MKIELTEFKPGQNDPYELRNAIKVSYYGLEPEQVSSCDEVRTYIDFHGQRVVTNGADAAVINFDNQSMESIHSRERIPTIYIQIKNSKADGILRDLYFTDGQFIEIDPTGVL